MEDRFFFGRQIAFIVYEYFWVTGANEAVLDYSDLFRIISHGDDIQNLTQDGTKVFLAISEGPNDAILKCFQKMRIRESDQLNTVLAMYDQEIKSKSIEDRLSEVEDHGEKAHKSEDQGTKFQSQNRCV